MRKFTPLLWLTWNRQFPRLKTMTSMDANLLLYAYNEDTPSTNLR
jgi:hypothetical protein